MKKFKDFQNYICISRLLNFFGKTFSFRMLKIHKGSSFVEHKNSRDSQKVGSSKEQKGKGNDGREQRKFESFNTSMGRGRAILGTFLAVPAPI